MIKRELLETRPLRATKKMKAEAANNKPQRREGYHSSWLVYKYRLYMRCHICGGILKTAIFFAEHLLASGCNPAYELFIDKENGKFITYDRLHDKWLNSKLDILPFPDYAVRSPDSIWMTQSDSDTVRAYLGGEKGGFAGLLEYQLHIRVDWEIIKKNPFEFVDKPKCIYKKRDIWNADTIRKALDECRDSKLYLAMNLSFACSLRIGEILGLTWDNIHIAENEIFEDNAHLFVDKELQRASMKAIKVLDKKDIIKIFPAHKSNAVTRLVLKTPKTDSSVRKVWIPKTLAYIILEHKRTQDNLKEMLGEEYEDSNLVITLPNGRPCEERIIAESFQRLRDKVHLPYVAFHSLRHSSTTYKLKLSKGDIKAIQGDTGYAQVDMITDIYAHILDEDRKVNAVKMEAAFYSVDANPDLRGVRLPESNEVDIDSFIEKLKTASPEKIAILAELMKSSL